MGSRLEAVVEEDEVVDVVDEDEDAVVLNARPTGRRTIRDSNVIYYLFLFQLTSFIYNNKFCVSS